MDNAKKLIVQEPKTKAATAVDEDIMGTVRVREEDCLLVASSMFLLLGEG